MRTCAEAPRVMETRDQASSQRAPYAAERCLDFYIFFGCKSEAIMDFKAKKETGFILELFW